MSSDNYIYIRRYRGKYVVTDESASADRPTPIERAGGNRGVFFDDPQSALEYAHTQYSEYGMRFGPGLRMEARLIDINAKVPGEKRHRAGALPEPERGVET